jgi:putative NIF3 family GTP cyclohydrolase 1 type 2
LGGRTKAEAGTACDNRRVKTSQLCERLDSYFRTTSYPTADFQVVREISQEQGIPLGKYATPDFMLRFNGLMLDNAPDVDVAYTVVFTSPEVLAEAVRRAAGRPALIFTHHPMDFETSGRGLIPMTEHDFLKLKDAGMSLYSAHAPLDCHEVVSTSRALARTAGIRIEGEAGRMQELDWGVFGRVAPMPLEEFVARVRETCGVERIDVKRGGGRVERVAVIAGGATFPELMQDALDRECDTYLTGDFRIRHGGAWAEEHRPEFDAFIDSVPLNLVGASHYATEALVMESDMLGWFNGLEVPAEFIPEADPWR